MYVKPDLPKRGCDNCGEKYKPGRRLLEGQHGFCSDNCRKTFHKHGGSFTKLKDVIVKEVRNRIKQQNPVDAEWQRSVEKRLDALESFVKQTVEAFSFRRSA